MKKSLDGFKNNDLIGDEGHGYQRFELCINTVQGAFAKIMKIVY